MLKELDYDDIEKCAPAFQLFFSYLRHLLSDNLGALDDEITFPTAELSLQVNAPVCPETLLSNTTSSASGTKKRPNSLTITTSARVKVRVPNSKYENAPHTPDRPTIPKNPAFSGDSIESTDDKTDDSNINRNLTYQPTIRFFTNPLAHICREMSPSNLRVFYFF
jgi:hypothetical protein